MSAPVHFRVEVLYEALFGPACGHQARGREMSYLDMLYADAPKPRERFLWPVVSDPFTMKPIRWFDSWGEATDFVSANLGKVNLFVGEPKRRSA